MTSESAALLSFQVSGLAVAIAAPIVFS